MQLTNMQKEVANKTKQWFKGSAQIFVLAGYAGTGKTTMINMIPEELGLDPKEVIYGTFTGKASLVLSRKLTNGVCTTLHKVLYKPKRKGKQVTFVRRPKGEFSGIKLFVVDECSMVSADLLKDLLALNIKVLFVGDHGQLPPVGKKSDIYRRLSESPDAVLTEIHRQAENNPIIHLSMLARQGKKIDFGKYGNSALVYPKGDVNRIWHSVMNADQIICGYNNTRKRLNNKIRNELGFETEYPEQGDRLICTRNNWQKTIPSGALVNGMIGYVDKIKRNKNNGAFYNHFELQFKPDFEEEDAFNSIRIIPDRFTGKNFDLFGQEYSIYDDFDFGYAVTCHKSQGSEWDNVFVFNEKLGNNKDDHQRWLYTAITRASNGLILAL